MLNWFVAQAVRLRGNRELVRPRRFPVAVGLTVILAGFSLGACVTDMMPSPSALPPVGSPSTSPRPVASPSEKPSSSSTPEPTPAPSERVDIETLPVLTLDPTAVTAICDTPPNAVDPRAGEMHVSCTDAVVDGLRALSAELGKQFTRARVTIEPCAASKCTAAELSHATVTAWTTEDEAWSTIVTVDVPEGSGVWATSASREERINWPSIEEAIPTIRRPSIKGAPTLVASRVAYPFCGTIEPLGGGDSPQGWTCFLAAVLAGRPAELLEHATSGEGDPLVNVYRYSGAGAVLRFAGAGEQWNRSHGSIILAPAGAPGWSYEPWPDSPSPL